MGKGSKYGLVGLVIIIIIVILYSVNKMNANSEEFDRKVDWGKTYSKSSNEPYGSQLFFNLLKNGLPQHNLEVMTEDDLFFYGDSTITELDYSNNTYVFLGPSLNINEFEVERLLQFVNRGGTAFLATEKLPEKLTTELFYYNKKFGENRDTAGYLEFKQGYFPDRSVEIVNQNEYYVPECAWYFFSDAYSIKYPSTNLGVMNSEINFMKINYGSGSLLVHTTPLVFSNYHLARKEVKKYVEGTVSFFPEGKIIWDDFFYSKATPYKYNSQGAEGINNTRESQLKFIFDHISLTWAYLLLILIIVLFVIFMGKRRQRVIPTIRSNENTTIEFIDTVSKLYYLQNQHNKLIKHMELVFLSNIRSKYFISTNELDKNFITALHRKSAVPEKEIKKLLDLFKGGSNITNVSDEYLIRLYKHLDNFYKNAR